MENSSINSGSLVILEDQRSADQRRQFLSQNAGCRSWTKVAPELPPLGYSKGGSVGWRQPSSPAGKRGEHGNLLLPAAWVTPTRVRGCEIGFYPERYI